MTAHSTVPTHEYIAHCSPPTARGGRMTSPARGDKKAMRPLAKNHFEFCTLVKVTYCGR